MKNTFKASWVFAMALGSAIGWGAFVLPYDWLSTAGLGGTVIGFLLGGLVISVIAFNYGLAIKDLPVTGGAVAFAMSALGRRHGFIAGWSLVLGYACIVALNASAVTLIARALVPELTMQVPMYEIAGWTVYLPEVFLAWTVTAVFAILNIKGAEISGRFQLFSVIAMSVGVLSVAGYMGIHYWQLRPELLVSFPENTSPLTSLAVILAFVPWAYVGFDSVPQLAGEFNFPPRKAMALLMWGICAATAVYILMTGATAVAIGDDAGSYAGEAWPVAAAIKDAMGTTGFVLLIVAVSAGVLTGLNAFFAASSRVLYSLGREGLGLRSLSVLDPKTGTPKSAVICVLILCSVAPWFGRAALTWVVDMSSLGITVAYFYTSYYVWWRGRQVQGDVGSSGVWRVSGLAGCVLSLLFVLLLILPQSPGVLGQQSFVALVIWVVAGMLFYSFHGRNGFGSGRVSSLSGND